MTQKNCPGCGAQIQSTEKDHFGFVPEHLVDHESLLCQRCFRINHYGRDEVGPVTASDSLTSIKAGLAWATGVVLVVDLLDFESGLPKELLKLVKQKELLMALNKADLIPAQTPLREVQRWVQARLKHHNLSATEILLISAVNGYGFADLADELENLGPRVLFAGVTNVGKSSVIQRLLQMRVGGERCEGIQPTISPYPGTTVSVSQWHCPDGLILADSPGYVPQGRISDGVSPECAAKIIPHRSLSSYLYPVQPGDLVFIKGLCAVECLENSRDEGILLGFTGSGVNWQKSTTKHLEKWLEIGDPKAEVKTWEQHVVELKRGHDLVVSGLGWVSARKSDLQLRVYIPQGVKVSTRPNLVGLKK